MIWSVSNSNMAKCHHFNIPQSAYKFSEDKTSKICQRTAENNVEIAIN